MNESKNVEGKLLGLQSGGCDCENQWPRNDFEKITYAELKSSRITVGLGWPTVMVNPGLNLSRNVDEPSALGVEGHHLGATCKAQSNEEQGDIGGMSITGRGSRCAQG